MSTVREHVLGRYPDVEITEDGLLGVGEIDANDLEQTEGFLLIEHGADDTALWLSYHDSPEQAAHYHDNQEGAEWWEKCELIDVADGETFTGVTGSTNWVRL